MNTVDLVGRLTKDPELKYTASGVAMARFTIAVNRQFKKEGQQDADFINCVAWRKTAENLANFQKKGNLIGIIGSIQSGSYEGKDGKRVYTIEVLAENIQFYDKKEQGINHQQAPVQQKNQYAQQGKENNPLKFNEDLPF